MKLKALFEEEMKAKRVKTDTGSAKLNADGSMNLNNSGYRQKLTPEQVKAAWSGKKKLPYHPDVLADMKADGASKAEMEKYRPFFDGEYWDFGDEQHEIPKQNEFRDKRRDSGYKMGSY